MPLVGSCEFKEVWLADFEFSAPPGERPCPLCLVGRELGSKREVRFWQDELSAMKNPPFGTGANDLFVAYFVSAEMGCYLSLGWPLPPNVLDLFVEFRNLTNGSPLAHGRSLLEALAWHRLPCIEAAEKESMRGLAMRGGPYSVGERTALLDYCASDVVALEALLPAMVPQLSIPHALLRGRYMKAVAHMECVGTPIDRDLLTRLAANWEEVQKELIREVDEDYGVYEGRSFRRSRFDAWLRARDIPWPLRPTGALDLEEGTFKDMARLHPELSQLHSLRSTLSKVTEIKLPVGADDRNRCLLSPFSSITGRNQPGTKSFVFGRPSWQRALISPPEGYGVAYIDWCQQEFGIAAALSKDPLMAEAYHSGDPYLAFAKQAGSAPETATMETHRAMRDQFKACVLAVQYGMGGDSLALRIGQPVATARELLALHRKTYGVFWRWSDAVVNHAAMHGRLWTVFGWTLHVSGPLNSRSLRNFPMQANGAEMLRLACCLATERGVRVCAPVHDAVLIEAPTDELEAAIDTTREAMAEASSVVLGGFELRSDVEKVIKHPDRYMDERGIEMWETVQEILSRIHPSDEGV